ncbi:MAG: acyl-CoA dehydrogenase [Burkholderiaceae bacterium]|nr:acyl-CoA dehydrogenase [Burkholderiaceae bacterium]
MALLLNEEQTMLRDSARSFLAENAPVAQLRQLRDSQDPAGFAGPTWSAFAELGFAGVAVPEAHGGTGLGAVEIGVLMEQIGRHLSALPFLSSGVVAARLLQLAGSPAQQAHWLPRIARGETIATLAVDDGPKHRPETIALRAQAHAGGWRLSGTKTFVPDGHVASLLLVAARTDGGVAIFAVPRDAAGLQVERTVMADAHNAARALLVDVALPDEARLPAGDAALLQQALDFGRAAAAAELLGIADEVFERTLDYLKQRRQFGKMIGEFQALQHRAATLYVDIELARAALAKALYTLDTAPIKAAESVAIAKAKCGSAATLAVQEGVQMHGGMGMTDQLDFGLFMKRARVLQELYGDAGWQMDRLARLRGY